MKIRLHGYYMHHDHWVLNIKNTNERKNMNWEKTEKISFSIVVIIWQLLNHLHEAREQTYMFKRNYGGSINQSRQIWAWSHRTWMHNRESKHKFKHTRVSSTNDIFKSQTNYEGWNRGRTATDFLWGYENWGGEISVKYVSVHKLM